MSSPQTMSFAQTYILASKVRSKLTREASSPKSSLRNLVTQANMLDNLMDYISEETEKRNQDKHYNNQKEIKFNVPSKQKKPNSTINSPLYKTSITEYEIDSDSESEDDSDFSDSEEEEEEDDDEEIATTTTTTTTNEIQLNDAIFDTSNRNLSFTNIPHITTEEVIDSDSDSEEEDSQDIEIKSGSSSIYSSSDSDSESEDDDDEDDSDDYYIYSDSEDIEEDISINSKIPRSMNIQKPKFRQLPSLNLSSIEEEEIEEEQDVNDQMIDDEDEEDEDEDDNKTITNEQESLQEFEMPELSHTNSISDDDENYNHFEFINNNNHLIMPWNNESNDKTTEIIHHNHSHQPLSLFKHENLTLDQLI
ncbi:hypothetical protein KGF54_005517 [Candida jiufengensis]|uniref:uncharacterized protein n=1 Tax=Candida jiufengensis TaxID=497108 RepID=UPI002224087F|nr:uncharacterized protein KGF54_005517 [Candida jiufengensis]KAI5949282.1 hypothetical protein KGF54_005517 [Candida jiufengensis]